MARRKGPSSRACAAVRMRSSVGCELALRARSRNGWAFIQVEFIRSRGAVRRQHLSCADDRRGH